MPYGDDITEGLVYTLSNPAGATNYSSTGEAYDIAIAGLPFFLLNSDDSPYRRSPKSYRLLASRSGHNESSALQRDRWKPIQRPGHFRPSSV